jgi:hypothetical protein
MLNKKIVKLERRVRKRNNNISDNYNLIENDGPNVDIDPFIADYNTFDDNISNNRSNKYRRKRKNNSNHFGGGSGEEYKISNCDRNFGGDNSFNFNTAGDNYYVSKYSIGGNQNYNKYNNNNSNRLCRYKSSKQNRYNDNISNKTNEKFEHNDRANLNDARYNYNQRLNDNYGTEFDNCKKSTCSVETELDNKRFNNNHGTEFDNGKRSTYNIETELGNKRFNNSYGAEFDNGKRSNCVETGSGDKRFNNNYATRVNEKKCDKSEILNFKSKYGKCNKALDCISEEECNDVIVTACKDKCPAEAIVGCGLACNSGTCEAFFNNCKETVVIEQINKIKKEEKCEIQIIIKEYCEKELAVKRNAKNVIETIEIEAKLKIEEVVKQERIDIQNLEIEKCDKIDLIMMEKNELIAKIEQIRKEEIKNVCKIIKESTKKIKQI